MAAVRPNRTPTLVAVVVCAALAAGGAGAWPALVAAPAGGPLRQLTAAGGWAAGAVIVVTGLVTVVALVRLVVRRPRRRAPDAQWVEVRAPLPVWSPIAAVVFALAVLATPIVVLIIGTRGGRAGTPTTMLPGSAAPPDVHPGTPLWGAHVGWDVWPAVIAIVTVGAIVALAAKRGRRQHGRPRDDRSVQQILRRAVDAGQRALSDEDARQAVIDCYVAMTRTVTRSGTAVRDADTATDVLRAASAAGTLPQPPVAVLTGLFEQARYSHHRLEDAHRQQALDALNLLRAHLERRP